MASRLLHAASVLVLSAIVASSGAACGGGVKISDLDDELVDKLCARQVRCGAYASVAECKADVRVQIEEIQRSVESGRTNYDEDAAGDCLDALGDASCDVTAQNVREQPQACRDAFQGTVADGGECYNDEECLSEDCNVPDCGMACCAGVCSATLTEVAIGGTCNGTTGPCVRGSFCDSASTTCTALRAAGGACTSNTQCNYGLYCLEAGTCADAPNRGDACPDGYCADIGDRCGSTTTCVALGKVGEACSQGFAGLFDCQAPLTCNQTTLQCASPPNAGEACLFFCSSGNFCNANDVCEAQKANGVSCMDDDECQSLFCDATDVCAEEPVCG